ncbi:MAG: hypothetical protein ABI042_16330 [Verrucomicrobiota bacterium]
MNKRRRLLFVATLSIIILFGIAWLTFARRGTEFSPPGELVLKRHFGTYQLNIYRQNEQTLFEKFCSKLPSGLASLCERIHGDKPVAGYEILKHGQRVQSEYGFNFGVAEIDGEGEAVGRDITGDGTSKLAITDQLGRQGGGELWLFECGKQFRLMANVKSLGNFPKLKDLDGDGIPELTVSDDAFYHWPVCRDGEPMPEVILRWRNSKYVAAKSLMFKPAPPPDEIKTLAAQIQSSPEWDRNSGAVPKALWTNAMALIYSGHEVLAWKFVEAAWKPGFPSGGDSSKEDIIGYFLRGKLNESVYWPDLNENSFTNSIGQMLGNK